MRARMIKKRVELISRQRVHISSVRGVWSVNRIGSLRIIFILNRYAFRLTKNI